MSFLSNLSTLDHTLQVTSYGGTGTTMLYRFLEQHTAQVPQDHENWKPWKHLPEPPSDDNVDVGFRAVYLFGDPMDAVLSVFRRDYQSWHVRNMNSHDEDWAGWDDDWHLEDYLSQGYDYFHMDHHFTNWTEADRDYPILLLRFDALWERMPEVFAYLGLPSRAMEHFPERRERNSDWSSQPSHIQRHLEHLYGDLKSRVDDTPDLHVI
jgi:hypothetical protein